MPSPKRGTDADHHPFEYLVGVTIPRWKGVNKQASAASPQEDELRNAINVRPIQDGYISRPGQAKLITSALGSIEGMFEAGDRGAPQAGILLPSGAASRLYWRGDNLTTTIRHDTWDGALVDLLSASLSPGGRPPQAVYSNGARLYVAAQSYLSGSDYILPLLHWSVAAPPSGTLANLGTIVNLGVGAAKTQAVVAGFVEIGGILYITTGTRDVTVYNEQRVYSWDGATFTLLDTITIVWETVVNYPAVLIPFKYGGDLYTFYSGIRASLGGSSNNYRLKKWSGGVWTTLTLPAGFGVAAGWFGVTDAAEYGGAIYVAGPGRDNGAASSVYIFTSTGGNFTQVRHLSSALAESGCNLRVFNGYLYYLWNAGSSVRLGRFDGATWTDTYINLTTLFASIGGAYALEVYGGSLYAYVLGGGGATDLYKSNGFDTTTWTKVNSATLHGAVSEAEARHQLTAVHVA